MKVSSYVRPMSTRELFGSAFRLYRKHFFGIFFINLIPALIISLLAIANSFVFHNSIVFIYENKELTILIMVLFGCVQIIAGAPTLIAVSNAILGRPIKLKNIYLRVLSLELVWKLFIISIFFTLITSLWSIIPLYSTVMSAALCCILFVSYPIYFCLIIISIFSSAVAVLEKRSVVQSVRKAFSLFWGNMLRVLFNYLILFLIPTFIFSILAFTLVGLLILILALILALINVGLINVGSPIALGSIFGGIFGGILNFIIGMFITPFGTLLLILLYYDTRARKEKYNETLLAEEMGYASVGEMI
jgi:hypothetical protein